MNTQVSQSNDWIQLQVNVFSRWVQNQLKDCPDIHVGTITKDLSNGVALVELAKTLTQKDTPRSWALSPKRKVEMVQNCDLAVDMFWKDGVNLVGISGKDISDNNEKLILGLIWSLILRYSIGKSIQSSNKDSKQNTKENGTKKFSDETKALKSWAIERTENYPNINNFTPYELSMCALLDSYVPNKINYYSLDPKNTEYNSNLATKVMNELDIPILIYPEDIKNNSQIDDKTLLTQLSTMKSVLEEQASKIISMNKSTTDEKQDIESESENEHDEFSNTLFGENDMDQESMIKADSVQLSGASDESNNQQIVDDFSNKLFEEFEIDQESIIKADSVLPQIENSNQQFNHDFSNVLFEEDGIDQESVIKADSVLQRNASIEHNDFESQTKNVTVQQQNEFENRSVNQIPNKFSNHLNDHLLDHENNLKVDSRETKKKVKKGKYQLLQSNNRISSFFNWLISSIFAPVDSIIKQPENSHPYARVLLLNSPCTPFYYYVDYSRP